MIRKKITFYGRVQGVGFRYHANYSAQLLCLTGWVRNEYDGSVTMEIQGEAANIDKMIELLNSDRYIDIQHIESKTISVDENENNFRIVG